MNLFKKILLPLILLPILFFVASNIHQAHAQTSFTCVNSGVLTSTGIVNSNPTNKVYTVKLKNRAPSACTFTLSVSPKTGWTFLFHPVGNEATTLPSNNLTVSANSEKEFKVRATPPTSVLNTPGDYQFRVRISPSAQSEYEDLGYKVPAPTYKITLKSYLDENDSSTAQASEECKGSAIVKITQNGTLKATKTTVCPFGNPVVYTSNSSAAYLTMTAPTGFKITGLQVKDNGESTFTTLKNASTATTRGNATIQIGLKSTTSGGGTNTDACDTDAQCKTKNANKPACKNPGTNTSTCVVCTTGNTTACNANQKCENNTCVAKDTTGGGGSGGGTTACNANPPGLSVTEPTNKTRSGLAGAEKQYTLKVLNKDTGDCPARTMVLSKESMPSDKWSGSFSANNFSLAKGASKEITFKVTSPNTASTGEKTISVGVRKSAQTTAQVKQALIYIVQPKNPISPGVSNPISKNPSNPPTTCQRNTPSVVITQDKTAVKPGGTIIYSVTLTNNDTVKCADKNLKLSTKLPNDSWRGTFSKNDLSMKAGTQIAFKLTVDSPNFSTVGNKDVKLVVKNGEGTVLLTTPLSYVISENPGTVSPPISAPISPPISGTISQPISQSPTQALLSFVLGLDGIGTTPRINIGGNKNPIETEKNLTVQLRNPLTNAIIFDSGPTTFIYDPAQEKFVKSLDLPSNIANGTYNVLVIGTPYKAKQYPVSVTVTKGQTTNLNSPQFYMIAGNIDDGGESRDYIDLRDYNVLMSCSIFSKDSAACDSNPNFLTNSDLNSDGLVDQSDYTLWLKEKSKQKGDLPE